jgi:hypothetical protein
MVTESGGGGKQDGDKRVPKRVPSDRSSIHRSKHKLYDHKARVSATMSMEEEEEVKGRGDAGLASPPVGISRR